MIIVKLNGGLGNQMFQYALYTKLKEQRKLVFLDSNEIVEEMRALKRCTIFDAFELKGSCLKYNYSGIFYDIRRKILRFARKLCKCYCEKERGTYDIKILELKNIYLDGYWQTEKYFVNCREKLLQRFTLKKELNKENLDVLDKIKNTENSVSIHLRLGDYSTKENQSIYGNICTAEYYEKAVKYFEKKYNNPYFFVFSNDSLAAKKFFSKDNVNVIDINDENSGWADMFLMSQCEHNIIANSTFSWWGAWLNCNPKKEVIAPKKWLNTKPMKDVCPENWIRL